MCTKTHRRVGDEFITEYRIFGICVYRKTVDLHVIHVYH